MAKFASQAVLDALLDKISECNQLTVCDGQPTTYEEANSTKGTGAGKVLARVALTPAPSGDYTKQAGSVDGRRVTIASKTGLLVEANGNADHVALTNTTGTVLHYATLAAAQAVVPGGTVDVSSWDAEVGDPQ